jgi:hypothetical protein
VVLTSLAKGSGKVMRLSLVELGAGMGSGVVRGYRSYFTPRASEVTARPSDPAAVVSLVRHARANSQVETTAVDREGARLSELRTKPWEAVVVREDGVAELGSGVTIVQEGASDVRVVNRTGRRLVGTLLVLPSAEVMVLGDLAPGASTLASAARSMGVPTGAPPWGMASASLEAHEGLLPAWEELAKAMPGTWLPARVPVLLAQVEGGAGGARQAGLPVVGDRLLLRVVGWGVSRE